MKLTIMQRDIAWCDPATNRQRAEQALQALPPTDLIVLPEMFSTGFATQPAGIAESDDSPTLAWMRRVAHERDCAVAGSVAVEVHDGDACCDSQVAATDQKSLQAADKEQAQAAIGRPHAGSIYVNRFYFVTPDGKEVHYDKHHLFTYGGEHRQFTAGQEQVAVAWRGVRIRFLVCYDLRFPAWCRNRSGDDGYDLALFVASWPSSRVDAWDTLLRARAIENQCYVAGVNRVGTDPNCAYCGSSAIVDAYGRVMASCGRDQECAVTAEIDLDWLRAFRQKFPVLDDADGFLLKAQNHQLH